MRSIIEKNYTGKQNILLSKLFFPRKTYSVCDNVVKYGGDRQVTGESIIR
jgi:hypothetical protein